MKYPLNLAKFNTNARQQIKFSTFSLLKDLMLPIIQAKLLISKGFIIAMEIISYQNIQYPFQQLGQ